MRNNKEGGEKASRNCPNCHSERTWKDGLREIRNGFTQRFICRDCGYRFSPSSILSREHKYSGNRQVCAFLTEAKNLSKVETRKDGLAGATTPDKATIKGRIVDFVWWLKKQGYRESTIRVAANNLTILHRRGANLLDPESVKETVAVQKWSEAYKLNMVSVYTLFLRMHGLAWQEPIYKPVEKIPFIPTEKEIDDLIAGCGKKTSTYLQLLKETGMRSGEADILKWINFDFERGTVRITPEKNSKPRILKISNKCVGMLQTLPKTSEKVFGDLSPNTMRSNLGHSRKILARKLNNPRLQEIHFHTLRHWKATTLYHQTKDVLYVMQYLGHRNIRSTLKYIQLEQAIHGNAPDNYTCRIAKTVKEARELVEAGFEYVCDIDDVKLFRKPK